MMSARCVIKTAIAITASCDTCATLPRCKLSPHHCAAAPVNTTAGITGTMDQLYHCYRVKDCIAAKAK